MYKRNSGKGKTRMLASTFSRKAIRVFARMRRNEVFVSVDISLRAGREAKMLY